jgi:bifunctional UDP-N-acetylglucosamine pyrophosphorylase/glucosamine-1-phosphate N-acetyltransferase
LDSSNRQLEAIILAAGQGKRMGSDLAKVLHPVAGWPMIHWVIDAAEAAGCSRIVVVVGHQADAVRKALSDRKNVVFVEQKQQNGTGHAVMMAEPLYKDASPSLDVLVLAGDGPLIRAATLQELLKLHRSSSAAATLATSVIEDPTGYGRIVRDAAGRLQKIVEHKDASDEQQRLREVNPSYYCFNAAELFAALKKVGNKNANGEYYLTDVFELLLAAGKTVEVIDAVPPQDVLSINTPEQLAEVDQILRKRLCTPEPIQPQQVETQG